MAGCSYIWYQNADGSIIGNHWNGAMSFSADNFPPPDPPNQGVLEVTEEQHDEMEANIISIGSYGYHVNIDDPENPFLEED